MQRLRDAQTTEEEREAARRVVDFDAQEAECPACGTKFATTSKRCPDCGLNFGG
jgi:tRNA(Ile2) C34 agmatinyltransferase TiaS